MTNRSLRIQKDSKSLPRLSIEFFPWNNENKSCLNELKFWETSKNHKSSISWKFQLSISCRTQKSAKIPHPGARWSGPFWTNLDFQQKILKNPDLLSDKSQKCFYMKPDSNNPVPKPAISRFQGAKCGRLAFAGFTTNMAIRVVEFSSSGYKIGKIFA